MARPLREEPFVAASLMENVKTRKCITGGRGAVQFGVFFVHNWFSDFFG